MLTNYRGCLIDAAQRLLDLRALVGKVDPASGMSVLIRRGVLSDRVEEEDDRKLREYIEIETMHNMEEIINLLIKGQEEHVCFWIKACKEERVALASALEQTANLLPKDEG